MSRKFKKRMIVAVPENLFDNFKEACEEEYLNVSQKIREFMLQYLKEKEHKNGKKINN